MAPRSQTGLSPPSEFWWDLEVDLRVLPLVVAEEDVVTAASREHTEAAARFGRVFLSKTISDR